MIAVGGVAIYEREYMEFDAMSLKISIGPPKLPRYGSSRLKPDAILDLDSHSRACDYIPCHELY